MNRSRRVLAASGISAALIAGSTAFAFANGIFVAQPVDRVGSFQAMQARLVPQTKPVSLPTAAGAPPPESSEPGRVVTSDARDSTTLGSRAIAPTYLVPSSTPEVRSTGTPEIHDVPETSEPRAEPTTPTRAPVVHASTTTAHAHTGPSVVPTTHDDDGHETPGTEPSDD